MLCFTIWNQQLCLKYLKFLILTTVNINLKVLVHWPNKARNLSLGFHDQQRSSCNEAKQRILLLLLSQRRRLHRRLSIHQNCLSSLLTFVSTLSSNQFSRNMFAKIIYREFCTSRKYTASSRSENHLLYCHKVALLFGVFSYYLWNVLIRNFNTSPAIF